MLVLADFLDSLLRGAVLASLCVVLGSVAWALVEAEAILVVMILFAATALILVFYREANIVLPPE